MACVDIHTQKRTAPPLFPLPATPDRPNQPSSPDLPLARSAGKRTIRFSLGGFLKFVLGQLGQQQVFFFVFERVLETPFLRATFFYCLTFSLHVAE